MKQVIAVDGDIYTPYGATEALPVASISASEVLSETETLSRQGAGTCVGTRFSGMQWRVIEIDDRPLATLDETIEVAPGQIGELIVQGAVVTPRYVTRTDANADHKITDGDRFWHRMGDVGYLDPQDRFWFCGRKGHRVITRRGTLFTVPCEAIVNNHPAVYRSALVGIGEAGNQRPVIVVETWPERRPSTTDEEDALLAELRQQAAADKLTQDIVDILLHPSLPVDIRHNAKIFREKLAPWAAQQLANTGSTG
jgi:acyl-CoA synthetase (AMP-forming)/AMP-acid ligase II